MRKHVADAVNYLLMKNAGYTLEANERLYFVDFKSINRQRNEAIAYDCKNGKKIKIKMYE